MPSAIEKVESAAETHRRAKNAMKASRMRLDKMVREAERARYPIAQIARASGLSRVTVYEILRKS